eukprot:3846634-Prymnesium_polylepis.2
MKACVEAHPQNLYPRSSPSFGRDDEDEKREAEKHGPRLNRVRLEAEISTAEVCLQRVQRRRAKVVAVVSRDWGDDVQPVLLSLQLLLQSLDLF